MIQVPIGIDDFRKLREQGSEYVDKSGLICELIDRRGIEVVLLPRPRRFGKSLNLSMLRCFFEKQADDLSHLFDRLEVWRRGEPYRDHFQRYPVIHMTFKDVKFARFEDAWARIRAKIRMLFDQHRYLLEGDDLSAVEAEGYRQILNGSAPDLLCYSALLDLSRYLHRRHGERVVILIDEYDEPIHMGYVHGYSKEIVSVFRALLTDGLKGNPHLFKAVLTGILRIARESIFSGLNNLAVCSILEPAFSTYFGFTEAEVEALLEKAGHRDKLEIVRHWYNGYVFGGHVIYNPWSVLNFVQWNGKAKPYWLSTSSNDLIKHLLVHHAGSLQPVFEALLAGGGIERVIDENVVLDQLEHRTSALWSLLVFAGYLKAEELPVIDPMEPPVHYLTIPNREVRLVYRSTFREWIEARLSGHGGSLEALTGAMLGGDAERFEEQLQALVMNVLSYHDGGTTSPENLYHGFTLGLLAVLEPKYKVRSNRESGKGRPDVLILPVQPGNPGVALELKVARKKSLETALEEGLAQLAEKDYITELGASGAAPIHAFAVAFDGKELCVRRHQALLDAE